MSTITTILGSDKVKDSRAIINQNFSNLNTGKAELSGATFTGAVAAPNLSGTNTGDKTLDQLLPSQTGASGKVLQSNGTTSSWQSVTSSATGTVTTASVVTANGLAGSVATATSTPAITLSTTVTGLVKGNGTALSAAVAGTDYISPTGVETMTSKTLTTPVITKPTLSATNPTAQTYTPSAAATATLDCSLSNQHYITMPAGNVTLALSNITNNQPALITITQDSTGSRTVTWFSGIRWPGSVVPTLTTTGSKTDVFGIIRIGSGAYLGFIVGQNL